MKTWNKYQIKSILKTDFPEQLKQIKNCPEKLYYRGVWDNLIFEKSIAIVGSRRMTKYGENVVNKFVPDLVLEKVSIISGFMYGVDTQSHQKCIEFGGITVAVLGSGLDVLTPSENGDLYSKILETGGLVISEFEPDFQPTLWSFPQRNRIVSGLTTLGVMVVEAGIKSGSLITARIAKEQGKKVYAVPGPIMSGNSLGTNWLIKENQAAMLTDISDITQRKVKSKQESLFEIQMTDDEKKIASLLKFEPLSIDEISRKLDLDIGKLSVTISVMSLNGIINEVNGKMYLNLGF